MPFKILVSMGMLLTAGLAYPANEAPKTLKSVLGDRTVTCMTDPDTKVNPESTLKFYKNAKIELKAGPGGKALIRSKEFGYGDNYVYDSFVGEYVIVNFGDDGRHVLVISTDDLESLGKDEEAVAGDVLSYGDFRPEIGVGTEIIRVNCRLKK